MSYEGPFQPKRFYDSTTVGQKSCWRDSWKEHIWIFLKAMICLSCFFPVGCGDICFQTEFLVKGNNPKSHLPGIIQSLIAACHLCFCSFCGWQLFDENSENQTSKYWYANWSAAFVNLLVVCCRDTQNFGENSKFYTQADCHITKNYLCEKRGAYSFNFLVFIWVVNWPL